MYVICTPAICGVSNAHPLVSPLIPIITHLRTSGQVFAIMVWRLPATLESASSFHVYELLVFAPCLVYRGSNVSYT